MQTLISILFLKLGTCKWKLTYDGQNDDHKVEDVPPDSKVVLPECDDLQRAFSGEDNDEDEVDPVQYDFLLHALLICLHHHGHHVETNQYHDGDVKKLFVNQVKDQTLELVLQSKEVRNTSNLIPVFTLWIYSGKQEESKLTSGRGTGF